MRLFVAILAIIAIAFAGTAMAADVPQDTLSQMGIQNFQKVSDAQGMAVRGMGGDLVMNSLYDMLNIAGVHTQTNETAISSSTIPNWKSVTMVNSTGGIMVTPLWGADPVVSLDQTNRLAATGIGQLDVSQFNGLGGVAGPLAELAVGSNLALSQLNQIGVGPDWGTNMTQSNTVQVGTRQVQGPVSYTRLDYVPLNMSVLQGNSILNGGGATITQVNQAVLTP